MKSELKSDPYFVGFPLCEEEYVCVCWCIDVLVCVCMCVRSLTNREFRFLYARHESLRVSVSETGFETAGSHDKEHMKAHKNKHYIHSHLFIHIRLAIQVILV